MRHAEIAVGEVPLAFMAERELVAGKFLVGGIADPRLHLAARGAHDGRDVILCAQWIAALGTWRVVVNVFSGFAIEGDVLALIRPECQATSQVGVFVYHGAAASGEAHRAVYLF